MTKAVRIASGALSLLLLMAAPGWCVEEGGAAPEFSVQTFDDGVFTRATLAGRPALLVFWNTWCAECQRELPKIDQLAETFGPRGLTTLAVNTGINDSESKARAYWQKRGFRFPVGVDHDFEIGQAFGVRGVPTVFLIDAEGIVVYKGARPPEDMEARFERLTAK